MDYEKWIKRERRIRYRILRGSPFIRENKIYRICECGEVCLCHEDFCPNCNESHIIEKKIEDISKELQKRIRCKFRFEHLT
jgi:hypothetical protein